MHLEKHACLQVAKMNHVQVNIYVKNMLEKQAGFLVSQS